MIPSAPLLDYLANRLRLLLLTAALLGLYAALGFRLFPYLAQSRWLPELARQTGLNLHIERITLNPFAFSLELQGLAVRNPTGPPLLTAASVRLRLNALASLRQGRPSVAVDTRAPILYLERDRQGRFSLGGWQPGSADAPAADWPALLSGLTLNDGRLEWRDAAWGGAPIKASFTHLTLRLGALGGDPATPAPIEFSAQGPGPEAQLAVTGELTLRPVAFTGAVDVGRLPLPFWAETLAPALAWEIRTGEVTTRLDLRYPASAAPGVALHTGQVTIEGLAMADRRDARRMLRADRIALGQTRLDPEAGVLESASVALTAAATPWGTAEALNAGPFSAALNGQRLALETLSAQQLEAQGARIKSLILGPLAFDAHQQQLTLDHLALPEMAAAPLGALQSVSLTGLTLGLSRDMAAGVVKLSALALDQVTVAQASSRWGALTQASAAGLVFTPEPRRLSVAGFAAERLDSDWGRYAGLRGQQAEIHPAGQTFSVAALSLAEAATPWGAVNGLSLDGLAGDARTPALQLRTVTAAGATLPWMSLSSIAGEQIAVEGAGRRLTVGKGRVNRLVSAQASVDELAAEGLTLDLARQRFTVQSAVLADAVALGPVAEEPAPNPANHPDADPRPAVSGAPAASPAGNPPRPARLGKLRIKAAQGDLEERRFAAREIASEQLTLDLIRLNKGAWEIRGLPAFSVPSPGAASSAPPVSLALDALRLQDYSINFQDETTSPPARLRCNGLKLTAFDVANGRGDTLTFRLQSQIGGSARLEMEGRMQFRPFRTSFRFGLDKLRLRSIEPYWKPLTNVDLQRGNLSLWGDAVIRMDSRLRVDYAGGAEVLDFDAIDRSRREPVMRWNLLKFDGLSVSNQPRRFVTRVLTAEQPYARIVLNEQSELNLLAALEPPSQAAIPPALEAFQVEATPRSQLPATSIGLLRIKEGVVDFTDKTLKPGFTTQIRQLEGTVSGLSSRAGSLANLMLGGRLNRNAPVTVFGEVATMDYRNHTDVTLQFKGLNLTTFSAYSGKFAGYRIEKGKLDMDLRYQLLKDGVMEVANRAVLDQLTLGERVDDSGSWLADFAILLLKNGEGKIDIDLPIYGSLTDPQFSLWKLYRNAFTSLFAKLIYSPASLVSGLIGGELRHDTLHFAAGQSAVDTGNGGLLKTIAATMTEDASATIDIAAAADPWQDRWALAAVKLLDTLKVSRRRELRAQGIRLHGAPTPDLTDEDYRRLFTAYYREQYPLAPELRTLEPRRSALDGADFERALGKALDAWPVDETEIRSLAQARGENVRAYLIEELGIADERIFLRAVEMAGYPKDAIETRLTVSSF